MANAEEVGVSLVDYGLPDEFEHLKKAAKTTTSNKDYRFSSLFQRLLEEGASDIVRLGQWVSYLRDNNYEADMDVLNDF